MADKRQSLVLITVDCLRADHCGFYGYSRPTTPFLDSLATESTVVSTAVTAGAPTYYSLPAILGSRMPLALGRDVLGLAPGEDTLASALRRAGYATAAFSAANPYISSRFGYDQGFEVFRDFLDYGAAAAAPINNPATSDKHRRAAVNRWLRNFASDAGLKALYDELYFQYCLRIAAPKVESTDTLRKFPSADVVVEAAESWLSLLDARPFFLWIHLMDPHSPYYPPAAVLRDLIGWDLPAPRIRYLNEVWNRSDLTPTRLEHYRKDVVGLYDAAIRWVDNQIAHLSKFLQASGRWDDCVFALTADHGEEFLDHGRRYHAPVGLMEEIVRVPLLFRVPSRSITEQAPARQVDQRLCSGRAEMIFSHLHLAPTLLDILDLPAPSGFQGASLRRRLLEATCPGVTHDVPTSEDFTDTAITECVCGYSNPLNPESRLAPRLLSVRDNRYKLVIQLEPGAIERLYDLSSDPTETHPLEGRSTAEIRKRLLRIAAQHIEKTKSIRPAEARLKGRLRDLRSHLDTTQCLSWSHKAS